MSSVVGHWPQAGMRVSLELAAAQSHGARYVGEVVVPDARRAVTVEIASDGTVRVDLAVPEPREVGVAPAPLQSGDEAFVKQLARQLHRQAFEASDDGGAPRWSRRVQRWRGPK